MTEESSSAFAKHAQEDGALGASAVNPVGGLTACGKVALFLLLPTIAGLFGMYIAYLERVGTPEKEIKIESDFAMPFMLTLLLIVVIGFQTQGYTKDKVTPIVKWPKMRKQRKIVHKHVVRAIKKPNSVEDENEPEKDGEAKKKD